MRRRLTRTGRLLLGKLGRRRVWARRREVIEGVDVRRKTPGRGLLRVGLPEE